MLTAPSLNRPGLSVHFKRALSKAPYAVLALVSLIGLSCGKRRPPVPPSESVVQRVEIAGFQRGAQVILTWKMPAKNAKKSSVLNVNRVDVYRLAERQTSPLSVSEEEFASRSVLVATLPVAEADFTAGSMIYRDQLQFSGQAVRLRYAIRFVNSAGQKAGFSNYYLLEPAAAIASAPTSLSTSLSQYAVTLSWTSPPANVDGTTPANILGYNVYRSPSDKQPAKLLNQQPVTTANYRDEFFEFGKEYFYFVRAVSTGAGGDPVESGESNIVTIRPVDTFPPSAPAAVTLAATPSTISIFFAANPENDIAGYRVYRAADLNLDRSKWEVLTPTPLETNTFQDTKVEKGRTYHYYITAVDKAGNVSEASEVVSETVP